MADTVKLQVTVSDSVFAKLNDLCESLGLSKSAVVALAITEYMRKEEAQK